MKTINLKISLMLIEPVIWRLIRVSEKASLLDLHYIIQHVFGWTKPHFFILLIKSMTFVNVPCWDKDVFHFLFAAVTILEDLVSKRIFVREETIYPNDTGDEWKNENEIVSFDDPVGLFSGAMCMEKTRAFPSGDISNNPGYLVFSPSERARCQCNPVVSGMRLITRVLKWEACCI
jgi:hypothetical protein